MLSEVAVKNFALLEDLRLELGPGLIALTGETGAGKSLLLEALGLVLGRRADAGQVRRGAERLVVSARFQHLGRRMKSLLNELGLSEGAEDELLLRREIDAAGKSRAFANDQPVNVSTLVRLGNCWCSLMGKANNSCCYVRRNSGPFWIRMGGSRTSWIGWKRLSWKWQARLAERDALALSEQERAQRLDLYRFQKRELDEANVRAEEESELDALLPQLRNGDKLKSVALEAHGFLHAQEASAIDLVQKVQRDVELLRTLGAPLSDVADLLSGATVHLEEAAQRLEVFASGVEADPARLEDVLSRLDVLGKLKRKYGPLLEDVIAYRARVTEELDRLENVEGKRHDIDRRLAEADERLVTQSAVPMSEGRRKAAKTMSAAVQKELKEVGLPHSTFLVEVMTEAERPASFGADQVRFLFNANPGEGRSPLSETASGGELSRVMLAIESVFVRADNVPVLIFDEIDAGVGGSVGGVLGKKLFALGRGRQVVCVTHLATIAACADAHWTVEKEIRGRPNPRGFAKTQRRGTPD